MYGLWKLHESKLTAEIWGNPIYNCRQTFKSCFFGAQKFSNYKTNSKVTLTIWWFSNIGLFFGMVCLVPETRVVNEKSLCNYTHCQWITCNFFSTGLRIKVTTGYPFNMAACKFLLSLNRICEQWVSREVVKPLVFSLGVA